MKVLCAVYILRRTPDCAPKLTGRNCLKNLRIARATGQQSHVVYPQAHRNLPFCSSVPTDLIELGVMVVGSVRLLRYVGQPKYVFPRFRYTRWMSTRDTPLCFLESGTASPLPTSFVSDVPAQLQIRDPFWRRSLALSLHGWVPRKRSMQRLSLPRLPLSKRTVRVPRME